MTINVLYFASLREEIGRANDQFEFSSDELVDLSIIKLWQHATGEAIFPEQLLVAVNQEYQDSKALVKDGDEVAFFPPVTGG